jgi:hypothetical protein
MATLYWTGGTSTSWHTASNWSTASGGTGNGTVPTSVDAVIFNGDGNTNCTVSSAAACLSINFSTKGVNLVTYFQGTFTLNSTLTVGTFTGVTWSVAGDGSGPTWGGTGTVAINASSTLTPLQKTGSGSIPAGLPGANLTITSAVVALASSFSISGNLTLNGATVNSNTLTVGGNISTSAGTGNGGTVAYVMNGTGSLTTGGSGAAISNSGGLTFNTSGVITISGIFTAGSGVNRSFTYTAGDVSVPAGSSLVILTASTGIHTLDLSGVKILGNLSLGTQGSITLTSDLIFEGQTFTFGNSTLSGAQPLVINGVGRTLFLGGNKLPDTLNIAANVTSISGTATIQTAGSGTCSCTVTTRIQNNMIFNHTGIFRIVDTTAGVAGLTIGTGTYTYRSGKFQSVNRFGAINRGTLAIATNATLVGFNRVFGIGTVSITNAVVLTMDRFFCGTPSSRTEVTSTGTYTVTFQDTLEKLANWVKVSGCTLTRRGQLIILNPKSDGGRNTGVRYSNPWPNGAPKYQQNVVGQLAGSEMAYGVGGLFADPAYSL